MWIGRRILAGLALAGTLALGAPEVLRADDGVYKVGDTVEALEATDLAGKTVSLADLKGKVAVLNFFSLK